MTNEHDLNPNNAMTPEQEHLPEVADVESAAPQQNETEQTVTMERTQPLPVSHDSDVEDLAGDQEPVSTGSELDALDIDAALAAVSSLSDVIAEQEAAEEARLAQVAAAERAAAERQARIEHPEMFFEMPPNMTLRRGHPASVIPGALLIGIGAWLTFTLTTSPTPPGNGLLIGIALGGIGAALLSQWLASGRWARGAFFLGILMLALAVGVVIVSQAEAPDLSSGWELLVIAPGVALLLSAFLTRPFERKLLLPALTLILGGAAAYAISSGLLGSQIAALIQALWPLALGIVLALFALPVLVRRRNASRS